MNKTSKVPEGNSLEENRFQSISEFKWCVNDGGEVVFEWKGNHYGIGHPNNKILISANCYEKNGKFYNANTIRNIPQKTNCGAIQRTTFWNSTSPATGSETSSPRSPSWIAPSKTQHNPLRRSNNTHEFIGKEGIQHE